MRKQPLLWKATAAFLCLFLLFASSCEKNISMDDPTEPTMLTTQAESTAQTEEETEPITQTEPESWTEFIQQDDELDPIPLRGAKNIEDIFILDIQRGPGVDSDLEGAPFEDGAAYNKAYLQKHGTYKNTPDRVDQFEDIWYDDWRIEEYTNNGKTSCIIYNDGLKYCFTYTQEDLKKIGSIAYDKTHESLYDAEENLIASISYEYLKGIPFPLIDGFSGAKQFAEYTDKHRECGDFFVLNRSNKFWLYKDLAVFDGTRVIGYNGLKNSGDSYKKQPIVDHLMKEFIYDKNGKLKRIQEKFPEDWDEYDFDPGEFCSEITLDYRSDDTLKMVDYSFGWGGYGTFDCTGKIYNDKLGRMMNMRYYVTHGAHYFFYLYEGESKRPWACIGLCTFGFGVDNFYLFKQR